MNNNHKNNSKTRPVPSIKETIKSYQKFIKPFSSEFKNETNASEKKLNEFFNSFGDSLQKRLIERLKQDPKWLYDYIMNNIYLTKRDQIPLKNNYYLLFDFQFKDQIDAIAKLILYCVFLKRLIKENKLSQITSKCIYQYHLLFNSSRSPNLERDTLEVAENGKYIIIVYKNVFWVIEATLEYEKICDQIAYIISINMSIDKNKYIGVCTAIERDKWGQIKQTFIQISKNKEFSTYVEKSLCMFSLDSRASTELLLKDINKLCYFKEENKYFDKILQFVVLKDGFVAFNVQNDVIDQSVCIEFAKHIITWNTNSEISYIKKTNSFNQVNYFENFNYKPIKLNYDANEEISKEINEANIHYENLQKELYTELIFFNEFGKDLLERKGITILSFVQLAILAAYYKTFNKIVSSRQFVCGRTFAYGFPEWMRTTTKESTNFSVAVNELKVPRDLKIKLGLDYFKQYKNNLADITGGKSLDAHFTGLLSVLKKEERMPAFFEDEIFIKSSHFIIDTYPIQSDFVKLAAHPPPCQDGICITYIVKKDNIQFIGTAFHDLQKFFQCLIEVLKEMKELFIEKEREFYIRSKF